MARTLTDRGPRGRNRQRDQRESGPWSLALTIAVAGALGAILWRTAGPPSVPDAFPNAAALRAALTATEVSDADLITAAATVAWLALGYLAVTVALRALAVSAERATDGARWARAVLRFSNLITVPAVRRLVDGGVASTLLVSSWMPLSVRATAAAEPIAVVTVEVARPADVEVRKAQVEPARLVAYTVVRGDDLWDIARRMYGDGSRYVELFEANRDRVMPGGERFSDPRLIREGWVLHIPLPAQGIEVAGDTVTYRVVRGDHLWGIAARLLGDGFRWTEVWEANRDREMDDGRVFTDPNRIHPGWHLVVPVELADAAPAAPVAPVMPPAIATPEATAPAAADDPGTGQASVPGEPTGNVAPSDDGGLAWQWPSPPRPLAITVAGFAVLGGAALFVHRLGRVRGWEWQWPRLARRSATPLGDAARVGLATRALAAALAGEGFEEARVLRVDESARGLRCLVSCPAGDGGGVAAAHAALGLRLGCEVVVEVESDTVVVLTLEGVTATVLANGHASPASMALTVPLGSGASGGIVYLNLAGAGSVLVGGPVLERRRLLHDWLAVFSTTAGADQLAFRADTSSAEAIGEDVLLPHFGGATPAADVEELLDELEDLIQSRAEEPARRPLVALVDATTPAGLAAAERLLRYGSAAGVYVVALADGDDAGRGLFGARIRVAARSNEPVDEADDLNGEEILLELPGSEPAFLDPVLVRRDTSSRWLEGATTPGVATLDEPNEPSSGESDSRGGGNEPLPGSGPAGGFDWRRAIFEEPAVADLPDAGEAEPVAAPLEAAADGLVDLGATRDTTASSSSAPEPSVGMDRPATQSQTTPGPAPERTAQIVEGDSAEEDSASALRAGDPPLTVGPPADALDTEEVSAAATPQTHAGLADVDVGAKLVTARDDIARGEDHSEPPRPRTDHQAGTTRDLSAPSMRQEALPLTDDEADESPDTAAPARRSPVVVHCLGRLRVLVEGTEVTNWSYDKGRELLALLVARGGAPTSRQEAADALWPDLPWDASVKHMMSNAATALRATLRTAAGRRDMQPVLLSGGRYVLQQGLVRSDLDAFDTALRRAASLPDEEALPHYERALRLYDGDFLEAEPFSWLEHYHAEYRRRFLEGARRAGAIAGSLGEMDRAQACFRAAIEQEPADEEAARGLMRCLAAAGDRNGVRKVYHTLAAALQDALDDPTAAPSAETRVLLTELTAEAAVG